MAIPTSLYRFFDADNRLLYVGVTSVGPARWVDHEHNRAWGALVASSTVEHHPTRQAALTAEAMAIVAEKPLHNTVHTATRSPRSSPIYRRHGQGSVVYRPDRDRWAAITPRSRRWYHFRTEEQAQAFLAAYIAAADDPDVRQALLAALERA